MSRAAIFKDKTAITEKIREAAASVLPIVLIVVLLCFGVLPVGTDVMLSFLTGTLFVILGIGLFSLGADISMVPIGTKVGTALTKTRRLGLILPVAFILGFSVTVAEPDLQVLAATVPHINSAVLLITVGIGVGFFLTVCMLRIITGINLRRLLIVFYAAVFVLAAFTDPEFLSIAFDSGGVTTGPMTVPFILALGIGVSNIRSDKKAEADSFGLVALCSIGPIIAVMLLGLFYPAQSADTQITAAQYADTVNRSLLLTGTLLHDFAKEQEFSFSELGLVTDYSTKGQLLGHLVMGAQEIAALSAELDLPEEKAMLLEHLILSHHGQPEFGAAVLPQCAEAELLSLVDQIDSRMEIYREVLAPLKAGEFSQRVFALDNRRIYKHE